MHCLDGMVGMGIGWRGIENKIHFCIFGVSGGCEDMHSPSGSGKSALPFWCCCQWAAWSWTYHCTFPSSGFQVSLHTDEHLSLKICDGHWRTLSPLIQTTWLMKVSVEYYGNLMSIPDHIFSGERDDHCWNKAGRQEQLLILAPHSCWEQKAFPTALPYALAFVRLNTAERFKVHSMQNQLILQWLWQENVNTEWKRVL